MYVCMYVCMYLRTCNLTQIEHVTSFSSSDTIHDEEHSGFINLVPGVVSSGSAFPVNLFSL